VGPIETAQPGKRCRCIHAFERRGETAGDSSTQLHDPIVVLPARRASWLDGIAPRKWITAFLWDPAEE